MKEQRKIPVTKVQRASKFFKTGAKVGGNYIKHYSKKLFNPELSNDELHENNAEDIYDSLSQLKGGALKIAQMLSMDKNILPTAFQDKFAMAQYSAPPLSYPLVVKTFHEYFGKGPNDLFDTFTRQAVNAASIGQVHQATINGKKLAVKVQYPGVRDSIYSDLKMVRPMATAMFKMNPKDVDLFADEVAGKLIEETDYLLELNRSMELTSLCKHLDGVVFPNYYPEFSAERVLVMDWIEGMHLREWVKTNPSQEERNRIGQLLWDFYDYQIHELKQLHADPHPGNFIITPNNELAIIDFGCIKVIPEDFYDKFFQVMQLDMANTKVDVEPMFEEMGFLSEHDTPDQRVFFTKLFKEMIELLNRPFHTATFDFGDDNYFKEIFAIGERVSKMKEVRNSRTARGHKDGIYINRTYFGLYTLLNDLQSEIYTRKEVVAKVS